MNELSQQEIRKIESDNLLKKVINTVEKGRHILLHGSGGVGKSYILKHIYDHFINEGKNVNICALTGVAALGLSDSNMHIVASTLHRFAGVGTATLPATTLAKRISTNFPALRRWQDCNILIIDEISMLGAELFKKLCVIAKIIRKTNVEPMGGIQLILSGDFLQLPPVKDGWIFQTKEWELLNIRPFVMETPFRFDRLDFFELLLRVRKGILTEEDCALLRKRVKQHRLQAKMMAKLVEENPGEVIKPTMFFSRRDDVDNFNAREMAKLQGEEIFFQCIDNFVIRKGRPIEEDYIRILDDNVPRSLSFKVGSQVMLRVNLHTELGLVNGSRGVVSEIIPGEALIVKFLSMTLRVEMYKYVLEDKFAVATRTQIPFILADSCTIHKAQGATLDYCVVDLGPTVFAEGQAYVALSRCKNIRGLFISEFVPNSVMCNRDALNYSKVLEEKARIEDEKENDNKIVSNIPNQVISSSDLVVTGFENVTFDDTYETRMQSVNCDITIVIQYTDEFLTITVKINDSIDSVLKRVCDNYQLDPKSYGIYYKNMIVMSNESRVGSFKEIDSCILTLKML